MTPDIATQALNELIKLLQFEKNFLDMMFAVSIFGFIFFALPIIIGWIIYHLYESYFVECGKKLEKILIDVLKN
ncbi:MAG: hypothetical protein IMZ52_03430 [Actinobacteria bacterium]|nr:hypothetical protein [Actinomycetota bacterium]MBE3122155.1 hypothetical protein [Thermoplasmata archaeon]MBE3136167.1 hypothetical protein [Thermoplasmata archaeon]